MPAPPWLHAGTASQLIPGVRRTWWSILGPLPGLARCLPFRVAEALEARSVILSGRERPLEVAEPHHLV